MGDVAGIENEAALKSYLAGAVHAEIDQIDRLANGLNLVLEISTTTGERFVLRRPNKLRETALFIDIKKEFQLLCKLQETRVQAPVPVLFCEDDAIIGDHFYLMDYIEGEAIALGADPPARFQHPKGRRVLGMGLIDALADIHTTPVARFTAICKQQSPRDQIDRAMTRLDVIERATGHLPDGLRSIGEWLASSAPEEPTETLIHGDFRPSNVLFVGDDVPAVSGILDWETAMIGDPMTELGYLLLRWRDGGDPSVSLTALEKQFGDDPAFDDIRQMNEHGLAPFTARAGSPTREELIERYEQRTAIPVDADAISYYRAHAAFMLATVWADLDRHQIRAGDAPSRKPYIAWMSRVASNSIAPDGQGYPG